MPEKKKPAPQSEMPADAVTQPKTEKKTAAPKNGTQSQKGFIDRCIDNPGFPWMVIALLFTILVMMFWREHYSYWMWKRHGGNAMYKEWRMDQKYGPMMDYRGDRMPMMDSNEQ